MHRLQGIANTEHEFHELPFGETSMVDKIRIDQVLQVASSIVRKEYIDRLTGRTGVANARDFCSIIVLNSMVNTVNDIRVRREECIRLHLFQCL